MFPLSVILLSFYHLSFYPLSFADSSCICAIYLRNLASPAPPPLRNLAGTQMPCFQPPSTNRRSQYSVLAPGGARLCSFGAAMQHTAMPQYLNWGWQRGAVWKEAKSRIHKSIWCKTWSINRKWNWNGSAVNHWGELGMWKLGGLAGRMGLWSKCYELWKPVKKEKAWRLGF